MVWVKLPSPDATASEEDVRLARCRDLSDTGVAFYWSGAPAFTHVFIAVGARAKSAFIEAKVIHWYWVAPDRCIVGCRFLERVEAMLLAG